jgi:hypothetical protein
MTSDSLEDHCREGGGGDNHPGPLANALFRHIREYYSTNGVRNEGRDNSGQEEEQASDKTHC